MHQQLPQALAPLPDRAAKQLSGSPLRGTHQAGGPRARPHSVAGAGTAGPAAARRLPGLAGASPPAAGGRARSAGTSARRSWLQQPDHSQRGARLGRQSEPAMSTWNSRRTAGRRRVRGNRRWSSSPGGGSASCPVGLGSAQPLHAGSPASASPLAFTCSTASCCQ